MPDVVDAQLRLQFLGRDVMLPSVMASDPAHDPNAVGPLSPSLHLSTRLVPVSTGNSTNEEGS